MLLPSPIWPVAASDEFDPVAVVTAGLFNQFTFTGPVAGPGPCCAPCWLSGLFCGAKLSVPWNGAGGAVVGADSAGEGGTAASAGLLDGSCAACACCARA